MTVDKASSLWVKPSEGKTNNEATCPSAHQTYFILSFYLSKGVNVESSSCSTSSGSIDCVSSKLVKLIPRGIDSSQAEIIEKNRIYSFALPFFTPRSVFSQFPIFPVPGSNPGQALGFSSEAIQSENPHKISENVWTWPCELFLDHFMHNEMDLQLLTETSMYLKICIQMINTDTTVDNW